MVATSVEPGSGTNPTGSMRPTARGLEWDPFRGLHHGQRLTVPHQQAGYMTASDRPPLSCRMLLQRGRPYMIRGPSSALSAGTVSAAWLTLGPRVKPEDDHPF
jgi:hypothetical protein